MKWRLLLLLLLLLAGVCGYWWWYEWRDHSQDVPILAAARRYGVEPALVKAVVWRESRFDPRQRGRAGEYGLMQIRPAAATANGPAPNASPVLRPMRLLNPATNTMAGAWYLQKTSQTLRASGQSPAVRPGGL